MDLRLDDGRRLRVYDTGGGPLTVFWHHGTPNTGLPPEPLFREGVRWVSYDRPGYGGSTPRPGRDIASAAADTAAVAEALGLERFAVMGHSGGGPHALACAALLPELVAAAVSVSGGAPYGARGLDWFGGMAPSIEGSLRAAVAGRAAKEAHEATAAYEPGMFTPEDHAALAGTWSWFEKVVRPAVESGPGPVVDDDLAFVSPWGFDPAGVKAPVLLVHGDADCVIPSAHAEWLAARVPGAELRLHPGEGHISVLEHGAGALDWAVERLTAAG
ncbi:alpha/beta hydrolase [Streptomyces sp. NPDC051940]|uniref:alpha/beta fold hydrolase n=1 Tax=Streptomyces sp. NPDC051940 TaxID=3155675 RepID=UPI00342C0E97